MNQNFIARTNSFLFLLAYLPMVLFLFVLLKNIYMKFYFILCIIIINSTNIAGFV